MQLVEIAEKTVRFHLSQDKTNQFIVTTVSKTTNQQEMTVAEADLADAAVADMVETVVVEDLEETEMADVAEEDLVETVAEEDLEETDHQERCTRLHVQNVEKNVKFHSNQMDKNQFIVMNVSKTINQKEATVAVADLADVAVADMVETVAVEDLEETEMADAVPEDMAETAVVVEDLEETDLQEKCTQLHVQSVEQNVRFHSNQMEKNQFIVTTVSKKRNLQETTVDAEDISHF